MHLDEISLRNSLGVLLKKLEASPENPNLLFEVALRYHALDDYSNANLYYSKLVNLYPSHLKGLLGYGVFLLRWAKAELALKYLERYLLEKLDYSGPKEFIFSYSDSFFRSVLEKSLESYKLQIEIALSHGMLIAPLGLVEAFLGEKERSREYFARAIHMSPKNATIYYLKGMAELSLEDYRAAMSALRTSLELNEHNEKAHYFLGYVYIKQKAMALANRHLRKAIEINPKFDLAYILLGKFLYMQGSYEEAIEAFRKAITLKGDNWQSYYYMGLCFKELYDYSSAKKMIEHAWELNPHSYEVLYELAEILMAEGNWRRSIEILSKLTELAPLEWEPYYKLSIAYERTGNIAQAKEVAKKAWELNPQSFQLAFNLGILSFKTGDEDTALKAFQKAADLNPRDLHSRYYLGLIYLKKREYPKALKYLEEALKVNPHKPETRYYLGMVYAMANKLDKAIELYEEALKDKSDDPLLLFNLGAAYAREGKTLEAERQLQKAIENFKLTSEKDLEVFSTLTLQVKVNIEAAELRKKLYRAYLGTVISLAKLIDAKDKYTQGHTFRVAKVSYRLGKEMKLPEDILEGLHIGAWLHDIGKIGIPDNILNKPGKLTEEEYKIMKSHTIIGAEAVKNVEFPWPYVVECIKYHHERWDGSGYPEGLKGEEIPLPARIIAVADVFDALVTRRPYKAPLPPYKAIEIIESSKGKHFDPDVVDVFMKIVDDIIFEYYAGLTGEEDFSVYIESFKDLDMLF